MNKKVYEQRDAAFAGVSAYIVTAKDDKGLRRAATVAIKWGRFGTVTAFVQWSGTMALKGRAGGGGYDKNSAAIANAARRPKLTYHIDNGEGRYIPANQDAQEVAFWAALENDNGNDWQNRLRDAGFEVWQAV